MSSNVSIVQIEDFSLSYWQGRDWLQVISNVSLSVSKGEVFGLVGESGCGKSTLAYQLLGYRLPRSRTDGGRVVFKGQDLTKLDPATRARLLGNRISFVPQNPTAALNPSMWVGAQVAEVLTVHGICASRSSAEPRVVDLFKDVGLPAPEAMGDRYPHQLSGGQQQRVVIAMALACEPELIVLDEPTTGLDVTTEVQIIKLLIKLRERYAASLFYVTHDLVRLGQIADRIGVMYAGRLVEVADTEILFELPHHPYTRGLLASVPRIDGNQSASSTLRGLLRRDEIPQGCGFQPRCDFAEPSCATNPQVLTQVAPKRFVACQRWRELPPPHHKTQSRALTPETDQVSREPLLEVDRVSLQYGKRRWLSFVWRRPATVVRDVSFTIKDGETFALVGESGSGKSTIARAISGLIEPVSGSIRYFGELLPGLVRHRSRKLRRQIQYVFQNPDASLNPRMRIGRILARPVRVLLSGRGSLPERIDKSLQDVKLDNSYARRFPDQLSGGELQRVSIARALIIEPLLLLCDEVLSALDVSVQANVIELLGNLRQKTNIAMLFISHDLAVVRTLADYVGVLYQGQMMEQGNVEEIFTPPFHPYTHMLLMSTAGVHGLQKPQLERHNHQTLQDGAEGCVFAGRCSWQLGSLCVNETPPWREAGRTLRIHCHIPTRDLTQRCEWKVPGAKE
jgi:peptide/nickel transport system ATP-binding protein